MEEQLEIDVGKIKLKATMHLPQYTSKGNIFFAQGFTGTAERYRDFLRELGKSYTVGTIDYAGHDNKHVFDASEAHKHLKIARRALFSENFTYLAHSIGAVLAVKSADEPDSYVLLAPYINSSALAPFTKHAVQRTNRKIPENAKQYIDKFLEVIPLHRLFTPSLHSPVRAYSSIDQLTLQDAPKTKIRTLTIIPGKDELFDTASDEDKALYSATINSIFKNNIDKSEIAQELTHCFNTKRYDIWPFCNEKNNRQKIIETIDSFVSKSH